MVREPDATTPPTPQDNQLMSKHRVLSLKPQLRLEWRGQNGENETEQPDHSACLGDSIASSTRIRFSVYTPGREVGQEGEDPMKESTLSKISASVAVAKGMAQKALAASPNPQWTECEMQSVDEWIARQDVKLDRPEAIRRLVELGLKAETK
jgi:hypothetical protein